MSETAKLMELLQQQMKIQREQTEAQIHYIQAHAKQTEAIIATSTGGAAIWADSTPKSIPSFVSFESYAAFVVNGFSNWKKALDRFSTHERSELHKAAVLGLSRKWNETEDNG